MGHCITIPRVAEPVATDPDGPGAFRSAQRQYSVQMRADGDGFTAAVPGRIVKVKMPDWQQVGPHRYYFEDRLLCWEPHGPILPDQAQQFFGLLDRLGLPTRPGYLLIDQRDAAPSGPTIRRMMLDYIKQTRPRAFCAFVCANLGQRAFNQLLIGAARHLLGYELRHASFESVEAAAAHMHRLAQDEGARS